MPNPENIEPYKMKPGTTLNPNGRPKKIYTILKQSGYTLDDIRSAFNEVGWQTEEDLESIINDPTKPMIVRLIAKAYIRGTEKGDFRYVSEILQHVIGKPKEQSENKHLYKILVEYVSPNDRPLPSSSGTGEDPE